MIKQYKGYIIFFYIAAIASLVVATFRDLQIDIALNNPTNAFAIWFKNTGEMPSRLVCPLAGLVLFYLAQKKIWKVIGAIVEMGGSAYLGYHIADYFFAEDENQIIFGVVYGIGFGLTLLLVGKYITVPDKIKKPLCVLAVTGVIVMFVQIGIIEGSKIVWGRVRMRDLIADGSYEQFTAWYLPQGITGHKSFPSGHTAGAGISYLAMFLPMFSDKCKKHKALCFVVPFIYTSVVAYTRMVMGAHYLSDVTMGAIVVFTVVVVAMAIIDKKTKKSELA
jgi:membrane-associated phospholipid phosphatase